jgi:hypothetical protein
MRNKLILISGLWVVGSELIIIFFVPSSQWNSFFNSFWISFISSFSIMFLPALFIYFSGVKLLRMPKGLEAFRADIKDSKQ